MSKTWCLTAARQSSARGLDWRSSTEACSEIGQSQAAARLAMYSITSGPAHPSLLRPMRPSHPNWTREKSIARAAAVGQGIKRQKSFMPLGGATTS